MYCMEFLHRVHLQYKQHHYVMWEGSATVLRQVIEWKTDLWTKTDSVPEKRVFVSFYMQMTEEDQRVSVSDYALASSAS